MRELSSKDETAGYVTVIDGEYTFPFVVREPHRVRVENNSLIIISINTEDVLFVGPADKSVYSQLQL